MQSKETNSNMYFRSMVAIQINTPPSVRHYSYSIFITFMWIQPGRTHEHYLLSLSANLKQALCDI